MDFRTRLTNQSPRNRNEVGLTHVSCSVNAECGKPPRKPRRPSHRHSRDVTGDSGEKYRFDGNVHVKLPHWVRVLQDDAAARMMQENGTRFLVWFWPVFSALSRREVKIEEEQEGEVKRGEDGESDGRKTLYDGVMVRYCHPVWRTRVQVKTGKRKAVHIYLAISPYLVRSSFT